MAKKREWKAWAIVMPNGKLAWHTTFPSKRLTEKFAEKDERVIRVRIVEE